MMKKIFVTMTLLVAGLSFALAQKTGYVDTDYILNQIPEYKTAQDEVERISQQWQKELEKKYQDIERLYAEYQAQEVLLPEDVKQRKQEEIFAAEREAKEYREQKFGYDGELFALQEAKVRPIQDKVFSAVEKIAQRKRLDFIFDKAGGVTWLYTNALYDASDEVLTELGYGKEAGDN
ncbi:MAG: OmpH family outer membrane protein [Bacteroidia bacterium]|nr:OmpH family outer membrane protein [Bacteroidia bacterium]